MKQVIKFLEQLSHNNNRDWFAIHKQEYLEAQDRFNVMAKDFISKIGQIDSSIGNLELKDCTYRIYRDTRFSHNKVPYKTHMGVYVCPGGKKSGFAGYYLHLEPREISGALIGNGGSLMVVGLHCPVTKVVNSVREEIFAHQAAFIGAVKSADGFSLDTASQLQRVPKPFAAGLIGSEVATEIETYLKLREFDLMKPLDDKVVGDSRFVDIVVEQFAHTVEFNRIINRAVRYAGENNF